MADWRIGVVGVGLAFGFVQCEGGETQPLGQGAAGAGSGVGGAGGSKSSPGDGAIVSSSLAKGGDRLAARWRDGGEGAVQFRNFRDRVTNESCSFFPTGQDDDGLVYHCILQRYVTVYYTDEDCTAPVLVPPQGGCSPAEEGDLVYTFVPRGGGCGGEDRYFDLGETIDSPPSLYALDFSTGDCQPREPNPQEVFAEAFEPDLSRFVAGRSRFVELDSESGLGAIMIEGEDGSVALGEFAVSGKPCTKREVLDSDSLYCLPGGYASWSSSLFSTASCDEADVANVLVREQCGAERPDYIVKSIDTGGCDTSVSVHQMGVQLESAFESFSEDECYEATAGNNEQFWSLGEEVSPEDLPMLTYRWVGQGRLQNRTLASGETLVESTFQWFDRDLKIPCIVRGVGEGKLRCLPESSDAAPSNYHADADCSEPLLVRSPLSCEEGLPEFSLDISYEDGCQGETLSVVRLETYEGDLYWDNGETCEPVAEQLDDLFYTEGDLIPLTDFAPLELVE